MDTGLDSALVTPERTCIGCRQRAEKADLVRLAWDAAAAQVVVDPRQRVAGRGCYLHPGCGPDAVRRRAVGRALRRPVVPEQVVAVLADLAPAKDPDRAD